MEVKVTISKIDVIYLESLYLEEQSHGLSSSPFDEWVADYINDVLFNGDEYSDERSGYMQENKDIILARHPEAATDEETAYLFEK